MLGKDPWKDAVAIHRDLAYVPGDVSLWRNLSGGEIIDLLTSLRGGADPKLRADLIRDFELDPKKRARGLLEGQPAEGGTGRGIRAAGIALPVR